MRRRLPVLFLGVIVVACLGDDPVPLGGAPTDRNPDAGDAAVIAVDGGGSDARDDDAGPLGVFEWEVHGDRDNADNAVAVTTALVGGERRFALTAKTSVPVTIGTSTFTPVGTSLVVALLNADKSVRFLKGFPAGRQASTAIDSDGNIYLAGWFNGTSMDFTTSIKVPSTYADPNKDAGFYAKLAPNGTVLWARGISSPNGISSTCNAIVVQGTKPAVACAHVGEASIEMHVGGMTTTPQVVPGSGTAVAERDGLVMVLDPTTGGAVWEKELRGAGASDALSDIAFDSAGNVVVVGLLASTTIKILPSTIAALTKFGMGAGQGFLLRFDAGGQHAVSLAKVWGGGTSSGTNVTPAAIAVLPNDDLVVCGHVAGDADLGQGPITPPGTEDGFVLRAAKGNAATTWAMTYGDAQTDACNAIATTSDGDVLIGGMHRSGSVKIGGKPLVDAPGTGGGHVARLDGSNGSVQWLRSLVAVGTTASASVSSIAAFSTGDAIVGGSWSGSMDFGAGGVQSMNGGTQGSFFALRLAR